MANSKITDLTALTTPAAGDLIPIVDVSDTTHGASGTTKKITYANLTPFAPTASPTFTGTVVLPTDTTIGDVSSTELGYMNGVTSAIQTQIDTKLASSSYDDATDAETTTGTSTSKYVSPDGLAGSDYGKRVVGIQVFDSATNTSTGDGKAFFRVPSVMNGWNLVAVAASVYTAGTTNTTDIQIRNKTQTADMLSTKLTIDSAETDSSTATPAVINASEDDVATGDVIAIDVDAVSTTPAQGLFVSLIFQLP
jgi:hypothetical protein